MKKSLVGLLVGSLLLNITFLLMFRVPLRSKAEAKLRTFRKKNRGALSSKIEKYSERPFVIYSAFGHVQTLEPIQSSGGQKLPHELVIRPGRYDFLGEGFRLNKPGLYRFIHSGNKNEQRIVHNGSVDTLLSAIAWIISHGNSDAPFEASELIKKAKTDKIIVTCGKASVFTHKILSGLSIRSRIVQGITLDTWNNHGDGHTLIEVYREDLKKWVVYDLDHNCFFVKETVPLSLLEMTASVSEKHDFIIRSISADSKLAVNSFRDRNGYSYDFIAEAVMATDSTLKSWYKRVMQVPLISDGGNFYFPARDSSSTERLRTYSQQYLPIGSVADFRKTFY